MSTQAGNHEHRMDEGWRPSTKELLLMLRDTSVDAVPAGWLTAVQIRNATGLSDGSIHRTIRAMRAKGLITETRMFRIPHATRGPTPVPHYWLSPEARRALGMSSNT